MRIPLGEASAKVRTGDPVDAAADVAGSPHWAGVIPVRTVACAPVAAADLRRGVRPPAHVSGFARLPRWAPRSGSARLARDFVLWVVLAAVVVSLAFMLLVAWLESLELPVGGVGARGAAGQHG